ncbi:SagB/ThcOx family dehydrogenase [Streptomyces sp. ODS28]|uniref:SagB/ThcOx family dehydrogenase n=1 Tax=Streptomyces sp. ODS28 TaxID=3136688 RepID=UPI0031E8E256
MRYRRSRCLTCYWREGAFIVHPYPHGTPTALHPVAAEVLSAFEEWTAPKESAETLDHLAPETLEEAVEALAEAGALLAEDSPAAHHDEEIDRHWSTWAPEAPFLHYASQDEYAHGQSGMEERETAEPESPAESIGLPPLFTSHPDAPRLPLPRPAAEFPTPYGQVLHARRTHRDFSRDAVPLRTVSALLSAVFGPVDFIDSGHGALYRRTSPSGGARQELDAYLGALNIGGLAPGWYHYNGLEHSLELLSEGFTGAEAARLCAGQEWAGEAAFLVVLAARLERMSVKYRSPRSYRVCLLNAGHLGQTFALTATALGLGPAQTGAFDDTSAARHCGLDNASRIPVYVLAAGHPANPPREEPPPATLTAFAGTPLSGDGHSPPPNR